MRAVASRMSATTCVRTSGMMSQGDQSWSARTARVCARKPSAAGRGGTALLAGRDGALLGVQVSLLPCLSDRDTRRGRAAHENKVRTHQKALSFADFLARS